MDKQFFVCYSSRDIDLAETLVEELEASGYKCWIASRDVPVRSDREKSVYSAILDSTAVLLVFSENATESLHIRSELDIATNQRIPIIPLKFRDAPISKSIKYYTHSRQWIDCTSHQTNTREIAFALFGLAKEPPSREKPVSSGIKKKKWMLISGLLLIMTFAFLFLAGNKSNTNTGNLFNIAVGGRDSWDYASDITHGKNGSTIVTGAWDWGYWSEMWVAHFDGSGRLVYTWSDSLSGSCKPLFLPTASGGCITVYVNFSEADQYGFAFRAVRLNPLGDVLWETTRRIDHTGEGEPLLSTLCWLPDSTAIASFTVRSSTDNQHAIYFAELDASTGTEAIFTVPGNMNTLCMATSINGEILHVSKNIIDGTSTIRVLDSEGQQIRTTQSNLRQSISCVEYNPDNSVIASGTTGGENGALSVIKFSEDFEIVWENTFDNLIQGTITDIAIQPDGSVILVGATASNNNGETNGRVLCLNRSGKLLWESIINTDGDDHILSVDSRTDGTLLLAGSTTCFGQRNAWFLEMTPDGEYNDSCTLGIDIFAEDWETGFIGQSFWMVGSNENNPPVVTPDSADNFALTISVVPVVMRESLKLVSGLCIEAEITVPVNTSTSEGGWVSIGTTEHDPATVLQEETDCEFRWDYSPEQVLTITSGRISPCSVFTEPIRLTQTVPLLFTIENYADSVFFLINDSLLCTMPSLDEPDSLRFFVNGNSTSAPHRVDNIRVFRRSW